MSPWPPEGEPAGQGHGGGHAAAAGPRRPRRGHEVRARRRARTRSSARARATRRRSSRPAAVAKALLAEIGHRGREPRARGGRRTRERVEERDRRGARPSATRSAGSSRCARGACRPGSARTRRRRSGSTRGWRRRCMGTQAVKGVEIGDGFALAGAAAAREAHDEIFRDEGGYRRETNRAGGIEAGISNGEEIVVRAAMKPLPTLMRPLRSADLETGEPAQALVERSDVAAVEALAVVAEACVAFELARAAREKFGGDALGDFVAAHGAPTSSASRGTRARPARTRARRASWARARRPSAREVARLTERPFVDTDAEIERQHGPIAEIFEERGEPEFRAIEEEVVARRARRRRAGGDRARRRRRARRTRRGGGSRSARSPSGSTVDVDEAWAARPAARDRPLARDEEAFRKLLRRAGARLPGGLPTRVAQDADGVLLRGARASRSSPARSGELARLVRRAAGCARRRRAGARAARPGLGRRAARAPVGRGGEAHRGRAPALGRARARPGRRDRRASGGGTTTDVAGFAAATYLRGIPWIAVADDARRAGRRGDRRQDRDRPRGGQEPRRRVPPPGGGRGRPAACSRRCRRRAAATGAWRRS